MIIFMAPVVAPIAVTQRRMKLARADPAIRRLRSNVEWRIAANRTDGHDFEATGLAERTGRGAFGLD
ncbi:hypothetical protein [Variovorax sp. J22R115]|uniref:hypothetical protein n=1 Tax=Variovorax sp. J22R115 TaxID=3053509 RepID=UPI002578AC5F|nr:hypothetical protein [Variovorax sp. J22R115]MDM0049653.1 hypothetical protein [Variovorax sp. J22R115]